jgi:hypothetical protein
MPRTGFETCNHTCGCILHSNRPHPLEHCIIFLKEGSSARCHAKSAMKHPNCFAGCPAQGLNSVLTRDPTVEEWEQWATRLAQAYAHRPDLLAAIPSTPKMMVNKFSFWK